MAVLVGTSGAWAAIEASLRLRHLEALHPRDLAPLLEKIKVCRQAGIEPLYKTFDAELEETGTHIDQAHRQFAQNAAIKAKPYIEAIAEIDHHLSEYRSQSWLLRWTTLLFPTLRMLYRKKLLLNQKEQTVQAFRADLIARQKEYSYKRQHRDEMVRRRFQQIADNVTHLEQMLHSPELAGANAELQVIDCLRTLPDTYYVCSDVHLRAQRKIRFNGEYLQSAQIDHLVIGPTGVFVLEVKRWSQDFVERRQFFDPYEQVARASYLCYDTLRVRLSTTRVRSVLVNFGVLPPSRKDQHVKVLSLSELRQYLTWSGKFAIDGAMAAEIVNVLKSY